MNSLQRSLLLATIVATGLCAGHNALHAQARSTTLETLTANQTLHGFRTVAVYVDDNNKPMGARFIHTRTGFTFDLLQIQSVPQAFVWVNSFPTSDMGEPHTQEHLLLGKGNVGRSVAELEEMSLASSSAFTQQWRTCYHFHTAAGADVYYRLFESQLHALLHPDYTDEEIRREVRNFGVAQNPGDGTLRLEEKGTVYNEMTSTFERGWTRMSNALDTLIYGSHHPLSYVSGGAPAAIRAMKPEDIRTFHREHYHLGNMGMVGSFPKEMPLDQVLKRTGEILDHVQPKGATKDQRVMTQADLPAPHPAAAGTIRIAEYPQANASQPGPLLFGWTPTLQLDRRNRLLLSLFLENIAGDATTNLYKQFIDSKTRSMDIGANSVFGWVSSDQGNPVYIGFNNVPPEKMTDAQIATIRTAVMNELQRIAQWQDGSPELAEFHQRLLNRVTETHRELSKFVNSPPGFGFRGTGSGWMNHLDDIADGGGFRRSVTQQEDLAFVRSLASGTKNVWRDYLKSWKLLGTTPYATAAKPSADLVQREAAERRQRVQDEIARLQRQYGTNDPQETIRRYAAAYDSATVALESLTAGSGLRFIDNPPLTLDDQLDYKVTKLVGDIPMVASTFDNMTGATTGLALKLNDIPTEDLLYVSALPVLMTQVGVITNGKPISYEEMSERLRTEIYSLNAYYSTSYRNNRCELVVRGAGNDLGESKQAIEWMKMVLANPDWRVENLPRIRDVVDQMLSGLSNTMQGREEAWVQNPAAAYLRQDSPVLLAANSFLTRTHNVHRLRWLLKDAGSEADATAITAFLSKFAGAGAAGRTDGLQLLNAMKGDAAAAGALPGVLKQYLDAYNALPATAQATALEAVKDLELTLTAIPDQSLAADWRYLCTEMAHDLLVPPAQALARLNALRTRLLHTSNARMFMIGSREGQQVLASPVDGLAGLLDRSTVPGTSIPEHRDMLVQRRLRERLPEATKPVFVGLVNPSTGSGVFLNSADLTYYTDTDRESMLNYLAAQLLGGQGAHGIFMKTIGAGLAYSNGIGAWPGNGRINYYAERCPELPQTLRFVIDEVKKASFDPKLTEYAIAGAFGSGRAASSYEGRGEAMASDLADGETPERISTFRRSLLDLRTMPNLAEELFKRMPGVYGRVLPGLSPASDDVKGGVFMVIGPEKQMALYEEYLKTAEGADTKLYRLYPRDFWMTLPADEAVGDAGK